MRARTPLFLAFFSVVAFVLPAGAQQTTSIPIRPINIRPITLPNNQISGFQIQPIQMPVIPQTAAGGAGYVFSPGGSFYSDFGPSDYYRRDDLKSARGQWPREKSFFTGPGGWSSSDFFASDWDQSAWTGGSSPAPSAVRPSSYEQAFPLIPARTAADRATRVQKAEELAALGVGVDWRRHTFEDLVDFEARARKAVALRALGVEVDWRRHPFWELSDWECQAGRARELAALGVRVDWRDHACHELAEMAMRIRKANELKALGKRVDWREYDYNQLLEMERRMRKTPPR